MYFRVFLGLICAGLIALTVTPIVRVLAYKIGAVDVPKDNRRMHKKPMPLLGGLSIFLGFTISGLLFCDVTPSLVAAWFGGLLIITIGILDDKYALNAWIKLLGQIAAAAVAVGLGGVQIDHINLFGKYLHFGVFAIPITILWIVGMTNAINLIDGLDGLACGVSAISSTSLLIVTLMHAELDVAMLTAILTGACIGFLPFNRNPAKIFMGDTGSTFLGFVLAVTSILGVFKGYALLAMIVSVLCVGLPVFDTICAMLRRMAKNQPIMQADRGHLHHKLIDRGFSQRQAVLIMYTISLLLGLLAIFISFKESGTIVVVVLTVIVLCFIIYYFNAHIKNKMDKQ